MPTVTNNFPVRCRFVNHKKKSPKKEIRRPKGKGRKNGLTIFLKRNSMGKLHLLKYVQARADPASENL